MRAATLPDFYPLPLVAMHDAVVPPAEEIVAALTSAIRAGHEPAFEQFHALYAARLYRHALLLARGNEHEARELAQAVWVKVATHCQPCANDDALWAWLRCVTRNAFIDLWRARSARERRIVPLDDTAHHHAIIAQRESVLSAGLRQILDALPADEQELLQAAYVDEKPLADIADSAGTSYKAVESRLGRLRARVRARLLKLLKDEA